MRKYLYAFAVTFAASLLNFIPVAAAGVADSAGAATSASPLPGSSKAAVAGAKDAPAPNFTGVWWKSPAFSESGWGINFAHQGDIIFATWFTYDANNKPQWFIILANKTAVNVYAGAVSSVTGPPFDSVPFAGGTNVETEVGTATITFADDGKSASFTYTVNGVTQTKEIIPQEFAAPRPVCVFGAQADLTQATNYQDLWWGAGGLESGWGINFNHQGTVIFATWFTYDANGKPWWLIVQASQTGPKVYSGPISTVMGPEFSADPFDPSTVVEAEVGTATITFLDGNHATFDYTVNGITQTKNITRQVFVEPGTVCSFPDDSESTVSLLADLAGRASRGEITNDEFLTELSSLLAAVDGAPDGVQQLENYLEANVVGRDIGVALSATAKALRAAKALDPAVIAAITSSPAYQLLQRLLAAALFAQTADPSGNFLQAINPTLMAALAAISVRTQILDAEAQGLITPTQSLELLGFVVGNAYDALRRLLLLQMQPIPDWLLPAPIDCVVNCVDVMHSYSGPLSEQAVLTFRIGPVTCTQTVRFTGTVTVNLTVHADNTVDGTVSAMGVITSLETSNPTLCPLQTIPFNETLTITGVVDNFTAAINIGGQLPGTLIGQLVGDTIIGQIQVTLAGGTGSVVLSFTLTLI